MKTPDNPPDRPRLSWVQLSAGALAAVSSAVALSTLGVAGTVIGAAVGSVVASMATVVYAYGLHRTRDRLRQGRPVDQRRRRVSARQLVAGTLAVFVLALGVVTAGEVMIGRSLASLIAGSDEGPTRPSIVGGEPETPAPVRDETSTDDAEAPDPTPSETPSMSPTEEPAPPATTPFPDPSDTPSTDGQGSQPTP